MYYKHGMIGVLIPLNSYVGGNYDTSVGYHPAPMYITGYTTTSVITQQTEVTVLTMTI